MNYTEKCEEAKRVKTALKAVRPEASRVMDRLCDLSDLCFEEDIGWTGVTCLRLAVELAECCYLRGSQEVAEMLRKLADGYAQVGHTGMANESFKRALEIYETLGQSDWIGVTLFEQGAMYEEMNEVDQARACYKRALSHPIQSELRGYLYISLSQCYEFEDDYDQALYCRRKALEELKQVKPSKDLKELMDGIRLNITLTQRSINRLAASEED